MAENADYLISSIVDAATKVDVAQSTIDIGLIGGLALVLIAVLMMVVQRYLFECEWWEMSSLYSAMVFILVFVGVSLLALCVISCYEMPFLTSQLDGLMTAYESLYGPLPEGVI